VGPGPERFVAGVLPGEPGCDHPMTTVRSIVIEAIGSYESDCKGFMASFPDQRCWQPSSWRR